MSQQGQQTSSVTAHDPLDGHPMGYVTTRPYSYGGAKTSSSWGVDLGEAQLRR